MVHIDLPAKGSVTDARTQAFFGMLGECCDRKVVDGLFDLLTDARVMLYAAAEGFIADECLARVARSGLARLPVHHFAGTEESAMLYRVLAQRGGLTR